MGIILTIYAAILTLAVWQEAHGRDGEVGLEEQTPGNDRPGCGCP